MEIKGYFDCAASTPVAPEVLKEMQPYFSESFGNPGSLHFLGQKAQAAVDMARQKIAGYLGVEFQNIVFTASATEANNLAIKGIVEKARSLGFKKPHLIVSRIEHQSVLKPAEDLRKLGLVELDFLESGKKGLVDLSRLAHLLKKQTVLVSVMQVNNETGAIQPIKEVAKIIQEFRQSKIHVKNQPKYSIFELPYPLFHTDSAQALTHLKEIKPSELGVDLMSLSSHKIYGPKGAAVLVSKNLPLFKIISPLVSGGSQEFGLRSGTENVAAIVGFAKAVELSEKLFDKNRKKLEQLKTRLEKKIFEVYPKAVKNSPENSISEILNFSFPGFSSEELIYSFDKEGIAVSAGSSCDAKALEPSHVLKAMNLLDEVVNSAVRLSFGRLTQKQEFDALSGALEKIFLKP